MMTAGCGSREHSSVTCDCLGGRVPINLRIIAFALCLACYAENLVFAASPLGSMNIGHWNGGAFANDKNGSFSHCAATAAYESGFLLTIGRNSEKTWLLAIANPNWNLTLRETFSIVLTFDEEVKFLFFASANSTIQISGILENPVAGRMRQSHLMIATGRLRAVPFLLNDVDEVMSVVALCVDHIRAHGLTSAVDFSALAKASVALRSAKASIAAETERSLAPKLFDQIATGFWATLPPALPRPRPIELTPAAIAPNRAPITIPD
jgi:hypothetical protein